MDADLLRKLISSIVLLDDAEWFQLLEYLEPKTLNKNNYFLKEGQICDSVAFITKGTLIYYKSLENGKETTTDFAFAGDWVTDNRSRLNNSPSFLNIKAIEDSELFVISNDNLNKCYSLIPKLEKLGRILIEQAFVKIAQQSIDLQTLSASERYEKLLCEYPQIFQKVPLYHIANYLGIAPKSLSRIRKG
ncbi:MAG: Crp/Fnr family transcriptional regulator [Bacteroidota bacterium]|nr:Crp/Fnr family transcriptional regulator [Bacteroidota bacterium]